LKGIGMGQIIFKVYNQPGDKRDVQAWWRAQIAKDLRSCSPEGLAVLGEEFAEANVASDLNAAIRAIGKSVEPYCGAVAVPFTGKISNKPLKIAQAEEAHLTAVAYLDELKRNYHINLTDAKSKTVGCKKCESSITRKYVKADCKCPVCGESLLATTYQERLKTAEKRVDATHSKLPKTSADYTEYNGTCWAVGGWAV
jgi:hypothetical protein